MDEGTAHYRKLITQDPNVLFGKPTVRGMRISVEQVLDELTYHLDVQEVLRAHPVLTEDDVRACLAYARDRVLKVRKVKGSRLLAAFATASSR